MHGRVLICSGHLVTLPTRHAQTSQTKPSARTIVQVTSGTTINARRSCMDVIDLELIKQCTKDTERPAWKELTNCVNGKRLETLWSNRTWQVHAFLENAFCTDFHTPQQKQSIAK